MPSAQVFAFITVILLLLHLPCFHLKLIVASNGFSSHRPDKLISIDCSAGLRDIFTVDVGAVGNGNYQIVGDMDIPSENETLSIGELEFTLAVEDSLTGQTVEFLSFAMASLQTNSSSLSLLIDDEEKRLDVSNSKVRTGDVLNCTKRVDALALIPSTTLGHNLTKKVQVKIGSLPKSKAIEFYIQFRLKDQSVVEGILTIEDSAESQFFNSLDLESESRKGLTNQSEINNNIVMEQEGRNYQEVSLGKVDERNVGTEWLEKTLNTTDISNKRVDADINRNLNDNFDTISTKSKRKSRSVKDPKIGPVNSSLSNLRRGVHPLPKRKGHDRKAKSRKYRNLKRSFRRSSGRANNATKDIPITIISLRLGRMRRPLAKNSSAKRSGKNSKNRLLRALGLHSPSSSLAKGTQAKSITSLRLGQKVKPKMSVAQRKLQESQRLDPQIQRAFREIKSKRGGTRIKMTGIVRSMSIASSDSDLTLSGLRRGHKRTELSKEDKLKLAKKVMVVRKLNLHIKKGPNKGALFHVPISKSLNSQKL